jgi:hypothetical protein
VRLDLLTDVVWRYDLLHEVEAAEGADGQVFGQGTAEFTGRLAGTATWANFPRLREGYAFPNAHGSLVVAEDAFVLFTLTGMSSLSDGQGVHVLMFRTDHGPHRWLNEVIAVGEGSIDPAAGVLAMRYYSCHVDYLPTLPAAADR